MLGESVQNPLNAKLLGDDYKHDDSTQSRMNFTPFMPKAISNDLTSTPLKNLASDTSSTEDNTTDSSIPPLSSRIIEISKFFIPIYCVEMTKTAINFTNMSIFSHVDENYAAAASFISSSIVLYSVAVTALNFYLPNLLGKYRDKSEYVIFYAFITNIALSVIVGLTSYFTGDVLHALGTSPDLTQLINEFYGIFPFAVPSIFQFLLWQQICAAQGRQHLLYIGGLIAGITSILWTITTVLLKPNLVPGSESSKIAGSYVTGYAAGALFYIANAFLNKTLKLPSLKELQDHLYLLSEWIKNGWPSVGHIGNELLAVIMLPILVVAKMNCSDSDLALVNVVGGWNLSTVTYAIAVGIATNIVMCGYLHGHYNNVQITAYPPLTIKDQNTLLLEHDGQNITAYWLNTENKICALTLPKTDIHPEIITFLTKNPTLTSSEDVNFLRNLYAQFDCSPYNNKYELAQAYGNSAFTMTSVFNLSLLIASQFFPLAFVSAFANPDDITANSSELRTLFAIFFIGLFFNSLRDVLASILRALDIVKTPMYASVIALWGVGITLSYILGVTEKLNVLGLEAGYCSGLEFGTLYLGLIWWVNSQPKVARENHHNEAKLAEADSFTGQAHQVARFFYHGVINMSSCAQRCKING